MALELYFIDDDISALTFLQQVIAIFTCASRIGIKILVVFQTQLHDITKGDKSAYVTYYVDRISTISVIHRRINNVHLMYEKCWRQIIYVTFIVIILLNFVAKRKDL